MIILDGDKYGNMPTKKNSYQKNSEKLQKKFYQECKKSESTIDKLLESAADKLMQIDTFYTRSKIELELYGNTSLPEYLYQEEAIYKFYFFVSMIGVIDAQIDEDIRIINFHSKYIRNDNIFEKDNESQWNQIHACCDNMTSLLSDRDDVIKDFENYKLHEEYLNRDIFIDILKVRPCYEKFMDLYTDIIVSNNHYALNPQMEFIDAYNLGYKKSLKKRYDDTLYYYNKFVKFISDHRNSNLDEQNKVLIKK